MSETSNTILRRLTDDYFNGRIDRASYIKARGALLDRLVGLEDEEDVTIQVGNASTSDTVAAAVESAAKAAESAAEAAKSVARAAELAAQAAPPGAGSSRRSAEGSDGAESTDNRSATPQGISEQKSSNTRTIVISAVAVLAVAVLGFVIWPDGDSTDEPAIAAEDPASEMDESLLVQQPEARSEGERVNQFLDTPNWTEVDVAAFLSAWDLLSTASREEIRNSQLFSHFIGKVRERIKVDNAIRSGRSDVGISIAQELAQALALDMDLGLVTPGLVGDDLAGDDDDPVADEGAVAELALSENAEPQTTEAPEMIPEPEAIQSDDDLSSTAGEVTGAEVAVEPEDKVEAVPEPEIPVEKPPEVVSNDESATEIVGAAPKFPSDRPCGVERLNLRSATCWDMVGPETRGPIVRVVPAGEFEMGQKGDRDAEPVHPQVIDRPFAIGTHEISVGEFEAYCRQKNVDCPERRWSNDAYPVVDVSWRQAVGYTNWLTEITGAKYRLPTEAEWEYAARAGKTTLYPFGDTVSPAYARFDTGLRTLSPLPNDDKTTRYNGFRLWHVAGNVREWTVDIWRETYDGEDDPGMRAIRGGSYAEPVNRLRSAARSGESVDYFDTKTGFRVVRELAEPE